MKLIVQAITDGLPEILAGPFDNWKDAERAQAYWAMRGKLNTDIIEA